MKSVIIVSFLLLAGVGGLVYLSLSGGATKVGDAVNVESILSGKAGTGMIRASLWVVELHNDFKPVEFDATSIPPDGEKDTVGWLVGRERIRVRYDGHDKIDLEQYTHVSVDGTWDAQNGVFNATRMYTQCPSHYDGKEVPKP